jgi:hypothetical protein
LCTRNISAASFDFGPLVAAAVDGAELGDAVASGVAEIATSVGDALVANPAGSDGARGLTMNPASATPIASAATSANGATAKSVPRAMGRIFIEHD